MSVNLDKAIDEASWLEYISRRPVSTAVLLSEEPGGRTWRVTTRQAHRKFGRTQIVPCQSARSAMRMVEKAVGRSDSNPLPWEPMSGSTRFLARF